MSLSCYWHWISSSHCQSSQRIHSAIASWIHSYFDNVMTKFMINNRTDAWKTDVNLLNLTNRFHVKFSVVHLCSGRSQNDVKTGKNAYSSKHRNKNQSKLENNYVIKALYTMLWDGDNHSVVFFFNALLYFTGTRQSVRDLVHSILQVF